MNFASKPPNADWSNSSMVALWPGEQDVHDLLGHYGITDGVEELHVTILYLGEADEDYDAEDSDAIAEIAVDTALEVFADDFAMEGGTIRHMGDPDDNDGYVAVAIEWDLDAGATGRSKDYRELVEERLGEIGVTNASRYTDFRAHTTLTWLPAGEAVGGLADGADHTAGPMSIRQAGVELGQRRVYMNIDDREVADTGAASAIAGSSAAVDDLMDRIEGPLEKMARRLTEAMDAQLRSVVRTVFNIGIAASGEDDAIQAAIDRARGDLSESDYRTLVGNAGRRGMAVIPNDGWDDAAWAAARADLADELTEAVWSEGVVGGLSWAPDASAVKNVAASHIGLIDDLEAGARSHLSRVTANAIEGGWGVDETAARLIGGPFDPVQARRYSQTLLIGATNSAGAAAYAVTAEAGDEKEWVATLDSKTRDSHADMNGKRVPADGYFNVDGYEAFQPGDPSLPAAERLNCFAGETSVVVDGDLELIYRRHYEGPMVRIELESGAQVTATPNHPAFRLDGTVVAFELVQPGDYLARYEVPVDSSTAARVDDEDVPTTIEQMFDLGSKLGSKFGLAGSALDFHGDGGDGNVDVVLVDSELRNRLEASGLQRVAQLALTPARMRPALLAGERSGSLAPVAIGGTTTSLLGRLDSRLPLRRAGLASGHDVGFGSAPDADSRPQETRDDPGTGNRVLPGQRQSGFTSEVIGDKVVGVHIEPGFSGHVYNLQASTGQYVADMMIVGNCRCTWLPVTARGRKAGIGASGQGPLNVPTDTMARAAQRGLNWDDEQLAAGTGVRDLGVRIAGQEPLAEADLQHIVDTWELYEQGLGDPGGSYGDDGFPNSARVSIALIGDESGASWARRQQRKINRAHAQEESIMTKIEDPLDQTLAAMGLTGEGKPPESDAPDVEPPETTTVAPEVAAATEPPDIDMNELAARLMEHLAAMGNDGQGAGSHVFVEEGNEDEPRRFDWESRLAIEGVLTGDGRRIELGALLWRVPPLSLMIQLETDEGHKRAAFAGSIVEIWRDGNEIWGRGWFDSGEGGQLAARMLDEKTVKGVSVDLTDLEYELILPDESEDGFVDGIFSITAAKVGAATIVYLPAFEGAEIWLLEEESENGSNLLPMAASGGVFTPHHIKESAMAASSNPINELAFTGEIAEQLLHPPADWFEAWLPDPRTPFTVTPDGRIFGIVAHDGNCHTGYASECKIAPKSPTGYRPFHGEMEGLNNYGQAVVCSNGERVNVGHLFFDTDHGDIAAAPNSIIDHYGHSGMHGGNVRAHDTPHGVAINGAVSPNVTRGQLYALMSLGASGHWSHVGAGLEMLGVISVNETGFNPALAASGSGSAPADGRWHAMVASGQIVGLVGGTAPAEMREDGHRELAARLDEIERVLRGDPTAEEAMAARVEAALEALDMGSVQRVERALAALDLD